MFAFKALAFAEPRSSGGSPIIFISTHHTDQSTADSRALSVYVMAELTNRAFAYRNGCEVVARYVNQCIAYGRRNGNRELVHAVVANEEGTTAARAALTETYPECTRVKTSCDNTSCPIHTVVNEARTSCDCPVGQIPNRHIISSRVL